MISIRTVMVMTQQKATQYTSIPNMLQQRGFFFGTLSEMHENMHLFAMGLLYHGKQINNYICFYIDSVD